MANSPAQLLNRFAHAMDSLERPIGGKLAMPLLRQVWQHGVDVGAKNETQALIAVIQDWVQLRQRGSPARVDLSFTSKAVLRDALLREQPKLTSTLREDMERTVARFVQAVIANLDQLEAGATPIPTR